MKKLILDIAKIIGAVATIGGSALWFDARFDASADAQDNVMEQLVYINAEQSFMADDISGIKDSVKRLDSKIDAVVTEQETHHEAIDDLGWAIRNANNFTPEQMEEILDRMFKKKENLVIHSETLSTDAN